MRDGKTKKWYIVGRKKANLHFKARMRHEVLADTRSQELIKVRGNQVAPLELEGVLLKHPNIIDVAVIGVPATNAVDGEFPRAYVVARPGTREQLSESNVKEYMADKLARYKQCAGGIVFVDEIPKTASGKILKRVLRERAKSEMDAEPRAKI